MQPTGSGRASHRQLPRRAEELGEAVANEGSYDALFCVVDAHAATVEYEPKEMPGRIFGTALSYLAAGLDPERCHGVRAERGARSTWSWPGTSRTVTPMGDLHRMTQFKEKSDQHKQNVNAGLFTYPVLMAADILVYRATVVPVGNDQVQHLELSREICRRFNARFGRDLPRAASPRSPTTPRIMGLDGKRKMSKSLGNSHRICSTRRSVIEKKLKGAFTDPLEAAQGRPRSSRDLQRLHHAQRAQPGRPRWRKSIANVAAARSAAATARSAWSSLNGGARADARRARPSFARSRSACSRFCRPAPSVPAASRRRRCATCARRWG